MDWKTWCRLCANIEVTTNIEPEILKIAEQFFMVASDSHLVCYDCKAYVQDLSAFIDRAKNVASLFEELEQAEESGEASQNFQLQLRLNYNLSVPETEFIEESEEDLETDMNEIKLFKIADDDETVENVQEDEEVEYLMEAELPGAEEEISEAEPGTYDEIFKTEPEMSVIDHEISELEPEVFEVEPGMSETEELPLDTDTLSEMKNELKNNSFDEEIVQFDEDNGMIFEEVAMEADEFVTITNNTYDDNIVNHFEFRCHICEETFEKMYFLTTHTRSAHNCFPRVLCKCGKTIGSTKTLLEHYENHIAYNANFRCNDCNKNYKTLLHYNQHMTQNHQGKETKDKKFPCKCGKSFKELRHLTVHRNSHLPNELKFVHVCDYCEKRYSSIFSLRQHVKHVHVKEENFRCPHCEKSFSRKANLDSHVSHVHTTERKFTCDICGLKLKTKSILRMHKKIHSTDPEEMLQCRFCPKTFKTPNQLTNHMVCHSDVKRYKCTFCSAKYKRSKELSNHIASAHDNITKFSCDHCSKTFTNNSNYRKHYLRMHDDEADKSEVLV